MVTARKAADPLQAEGRLKCGGGQVVRPLAGAGSADLPMPSRNPNPAEAAMLAEQLQLRLDPIGDPTLRQIAVWKLEGYTNGEIAVKLDRSEPTVERKLRRIREAWQAAEM